MAAIIPSILDNDFYKITMQCAVVKLFPDVLAQYEFINRGEHKFPTGFAEALHNEVKKMSQLALTIEEKEFLKTSCPYLNPAYLDFLEGYRYNPDEVCISQHGHQLSVIIKGYWYRTILWEVPLLALISELFYKLSGQTRISDDAIVHKTDAKMQTFTLFDTTIAEFGTRRRHSFEVQNIVMQTLQRYYDKGFVGTSNIHLAHQHGTRIIGTHAHEWFMYHGARYGYKSANHLGLKHWVDVYQGDLGIALSDTYTSDVFFSQFSKLYAKLFDGVRHDSGDPIAFAEKTIRHYQSLNINPLHKNIIFSDGLNPDKVVEISKALKDKIGYSFGIGTNLTNDVGLKPMNIVIKLTAIATSDISWTPTVKLSDEPLKHTGNMAMIQLAKEVLNLK
jgi:nicotinate phosphoribosyltransferase